MLLTSFWVALKVIRVNHLRVSQWGEKAEFSSLGSTPRPQWGEKAEFSPLRSTTRLQWGKKAEFSPVGRDDRGPSLVLPPRPIFCKLPPSSRDCFKTKPKSLSVSQGLVCKQGGILGWHQGDLPSLLWYLSWHADTLEPKPMTRKETRSLREKPSWSLKMLVRDRTNTGLGANVSLLL